VKTQKLALGRRKDTFFFKKGKNSVMIPDPFPVNCKCGSKKKKNSCLMASIFLFGNG
jgi:hypothetical protein